MSVTISITLDTRRVKKKTGKYPVKLLITYASVPQRYQTIFDLTREEFNNLSASRVSEKMQKIRENLKLIQRNAEDVANSLNPFSYQEFEKEYIYYNPLFRQRKHIKEVHVIATAKDEFDYVPFYKKYPILIEATPGAGTIGFTFVSCIKSLLRTGRIGTASNYNSSYVSFYHKSLCPNKYGKEF